MSSLIRKTQNRKPVWTESEATDFLIRNTLRQADKGLISGYEAYHLIRRYCPELNECDVIFLIIGVR